MTADDYLEAVLADIAKLKRIRGKPASQEKTLIRMKALLYLAATLYVASRDMMASPAVIQDLAEVAWDAMYDQMETFLEE